MSECDEYENHVVDVSQGAGGMAMDSKSGPKIRTYKCSTKTQGLLIFLERFFRQCKNTKTKTI